MYSMHTNCNLYESDLIFVLKLMMCCLLRHLKSVLRGNTRLAATFYVGGKQPERIVTTTPYAYIES